jgi:tripartite-type tricarboxylate transporter receptor subunit TctC
MFNARKALWTLACIAAFSAPLAHAQSWPTKPVRIVMPFAAGGIGDVVTRPIVEGLTGELGQQVLIDYKPGAGGALGSESVARSAADGYTFLFGASGSLISAPFLSKNAGKELAYDPEKDFTPVVNLTRNGLALYVNPQVPAKNLREFIAMAKGKPGAFNYSSAGVGTGSHLAGELFEYVAGVHLVHIPYRGTGPALTDLLAGQIHFTFGHPLQLSEQVRAGKLRILAISADKRVPALPDVPTFTEAGLKGFTTYTFWCIVAPARLPQDITMKMNAAGNAVVNKPAFRESMGRQGLEVTGGTPEQLTAFLRSERAVWGKLITDLKIVGE